ncbi:MAG: hypothetical protein GY854_28600 [Deltaproteobacteria bacterium]|nr:hypothetical protein [Deltaproteobacteria bacterium]
MTIASNLRLHKSLRLAWAAAMIVLYAVRPAAASDYLPVGGLLVDYEGVALDGEYDVTFALYAGQEDDTPLWQELRVDDHQLAVAAGMFIAYLGEVEVLDLARFTDNENLWLGVRVEADDEYPRTRLGMAPFATTAQVCRSVWDTRCADGELLRGWDPSDGARICAAGSIADGDGSGLDADLVDGLDSSDLATSDHHHSGEYQAPYRSTVVVSPVDGGMDAIANGKILLAALGDISDNSQLKQYLVRVEPGTYELEADGGVPTSLEMKSYVDIEGSGQESTIIRAGGGAAWKNATVVLADSSELRSITVEAANGEYAVAVFVGDEAGSMPRASLRGVTARASGARTCRAVYASRAALSLDHVTASASECDEYAYGIRIAYGTVGLRHTTGTGELATDTLGGVACGIRLINMTSGSGIGIVSSARAFGSSRAYGMQFDRSDVEFIDATISASGGAYAHGVYTDTLNGKSDVTILGSEITARDAVESVGIYNNRDPITVSNGHVVNIINSSIVSDGPTVVNESFCAVNIAGSSLHGEAMRDTDGNVKCAGVVDEQMVFYEGDVGCP